LIKGPERSGPYRLSLVVRQQPVGIGGQAFAEGLSVQREARRGGHPVRPTRSFYMSSSGKSAFTSICINSCPLHASTSLHFMLMTIGHSIASIGVTEDDYSRDYIDFST
jgi:hypothetical protein